MDAKGYFVKISPEARAKLTRMKIAMENRGFKSPTYQELTNTLILKED